MSKARECAKSLIRYYVERGDELDELLHGSHLGHGGPDYCAQIGGMVAWDHRRKTIADDRIAVTEIGGVTCFATFSVEALYEEMKSKTKQLVMF